MKKRLLCGRLIAVAMALSMILSLAAVSNVTVRATSANGTSETSASEDSSTENISDDETESDTGVLISDEAEEASDESEDLANADETSEADTEEISTDVSDEETVEGEEENIYSCYRYGDPNELSEDMVISTDEDGNDIFAIYENDLDEIIFMAENGMDLSVFFEGTVFTEYTLDDLYSLVEEDISLVEAERLLLEEQETAESAKKYENYTYGNPFYNNRIVYKVDENNSIVFYMFAEDIDEIIALAEDGMDLSNFFKGTAFVGYDLDILYDIRDAGMTIEQTYYSYTANMEQVPDSALETLDEFLNGEASSNNEGSSLTDFD